jgi:hypothetical protein
MEFVSLRVFWSSLQYTICAFCIRVVVDGCKCGRENKVTLTHSSSSQSSHKSQVLFARNGRHQMVQIVKGER